MNKELKIVEIILLVAILIGGGYWLAKKPAPVATSPTPMVNIDANVWKTYQSEKFGFEFQYPGDWKTDPYTFSEADREGWPHFYQESIRIFNKDESLDLDAGIFQNPEKSSLETWIMQAYPETKRYKFESFKATGIDGIRFEIGGEGGSAIMIAFGNQRSIVVFGYDPYPEHTRPMFDQIISTFHFIARSIDTSGWQTYRNVKYRFEFKYPKGTEFDHANGWEQLNGVVAYLPLTYPPSRLGYHGFGVLVTDGKTNDLEKECIQSDQSPLISGSTVDGVEALEYESQEHPETNPPDHVFCTLYDHKIYKISYDIYDGVTPEMLLMYQAMAKSFKFIK